MLHLASLDNTGHILKSKNCYFYCLLFLKLLGTAACIFECQFYYRIISTNVTSNFTQRYVNVTFQKHVFWESMFTLNLGHNSPRRKVHVVFKLVRSVWQSHPRGSSQITSKKCQIQIYCLLGTFSKLHIETLWGYFLCQISSQY